MNNEKMNASNSSGTAAESENGHDDDPKAGQRRHSDPEKNAQLKEADLSGGDVKHHSIT
ncbi:hypothetical protein KIN20_018149 [Parelaphostrongylus tenuis]|uniref:Uncharacterized protein n=1 Tax=Parelaphostrongylus tenuis TaxID=148309 RepID=A0AAD5MMH9_PARTN|nr:hypothetical protein KIN20_018149 [Parelaphostrongylus tenuis]